MLDLCAAEAAPGLVTHHNRVAIDATLIFTQLLVDT
jgi:hypothetical protein